MADDIPVNQEELGDPVCTEGGSEGPAQGQVPTCAHLPSPGLPQHLGLLVLWLFCPGAHTALRTGIQLIEVSVIYVHLDGPWESLTQDRGKEYSD